MIRRIIARALRVIQIYCIKRRSCENCLFEDGDGHCKFWNGSMEVPEEWDNMIAEIKTGKKKE